MLILGLAVLEAAVLFFYYYYSFTSKLPICRAGVSLPVTSFFCPWKRALGQFGRGRRGLRGSAWVTGGSWCFLWLGSDSPLIPGRAENYVYDLLTSSWDCGFGKWVHRWQRWDGSRCCWSDEWNQLALQQSGGEQWRDICGTAGLLPSPCASTFWALSLFTWHPQFIFSSRSSWHNGNVDNFDYTGKLLWN